MNAANARTRFQHILPDPAGRACCTLRCKWPFHIVMLHLVNIYTHITTQIHLVRTTGWETRGLPFVRGIPPLKNKSRLGLNSLTSAIHIFYYIGGSFIGETTLDTCGISISFLTNKTNQKHFVKFESSKVFSTIKPPPIQINMCMIPDSCFVNWVHPQVTPLLMRPSCAARCTPLGLIYKLRTCISEGFAQADSWFHGVEFLGQ